MIMEKRISSGLKTTFLIHAIIAAFFGLAYLLIPEVWGNLVKWPIKEPEVYRLLGAAVLGFAVSSWFSYQATAFSEVKIVVQMEIAWTILGTLVLLYGLLFAGLPPFAWVNAILLGLFAIAFIIFYSKE